MNQNKPNTDKQEEIEEFIDSLEGYTTVVSIFPF